MRAVLLGIPMIAGVTGAALTLAGVNSPVVGALTLMFVLFTPALFVGLLLRGLDLLARAIVAATASIVLAGSIAEVMLVTAGWSPDGGIVATAIACAGLAVAVLVLWRRNRPARPLRAASPAPATAGEENSAD